jgi:hypothetical protein
MPHESPTFPNRADPSPPVDALAAGDVPAVAEYALPDDILGESPPEHGWLGKGFVGVLYTLAPLQLIFALYMLFGGLYLDVFSAGEIAGLMPMVFFVPLLFLCVARSIQTFKLAGWGVAMLVLLVALFSTLRLLMGDPDGIQILAAFGTAALEIAWMRYFWIRRPDFT